MPGTATSFDVSAGGDAPAPSTYSCALVLAAGVAQSMPVPSVGGKHASLVLFGRTADFYAAFTPLSAGSPVAAAVPTGAVTDGSGVSISPTRRNVTNISSISVISEVACKVSFEFFF